MDPYNQVVLQRRRTRKRIIIITLAVVVLVAVAASISVGVTNARKNSSSSNDGLKTVSKSLQTLCSVTQFPQECQNSVSQSPGYASSSSLAQLVTLLFYAACNHTQTAVAALDSLAAKATTPAEKAAAQDCIEVFHSAAAQVNATAAAGFDPAAFADSTGDVQTWLSAAMTNLETCLDSFALAQPSEIRSQIENTTAALKQVVSNALAVASKIGDIVSKLGFQVPSKRRRLMSFLDTDEEGFGFPAWLSVGDRRLLQSKVMKANATVSKAKGSQYKTIQAAIDDAPSGSSHSYVILVKAGVYNEQVNIGSGKRNIMIVGEGMDKTIVTNNKNVVDGFTTFRSATFAVVGKGFIARDIQFQNTAGPAKNQAVALRAGADKSVFYRCKIVGAQDTLYAHSLRQFYTNCVIVGTVDFIFGNAASVFQNCIITPTKPILGQQCTVTAQGRIDPNMNTGIVIQRCNISASPALEAAKNVTPAYLGRPWKEYSRTVVMETYLGDIINRAGWLEWNATFALETLEYREFRNSGPGSSTNTKLRVKWPGFKLLTDPKQALPYTVSQFIGESIPKKARVPYVAGL